MRSVTTWRGAWSAVVLSGAIGAAGGCMRAGSFDPGAPGSGFAFAGDGPSCQMFSGLPGATDAWVATPVSTPGGTGVGCMNAVITVVAYEIDRPVRQWRGEVYWTGAISDGGDEYTGYVDEDGSIRWIVHQAGTIRVNTDRQGRGGVALPDWLPADATRVIVVVQRGYGTGVGASLATRGRGGPGVGASGRAGHPVGGPGVGASEYDRGATGYGAGTGALDRGVGDAGPRGPGRARSGAGTDTADTRGRGARGHRGAGTGPAGTHAGSPRGGRRASWSQPPSAELRRRGGRTPRPGGVDGGSAAGRGEPGDAGLSIGIALFGGVIRVPASIAPALEVTALLADAGVSPTALAKKWLNRALRVTGNRLTREIAGEAAVLAARESRALRATLSRLDDFARLPAAEQARIVDAATDAVQREYLERVERVAADEAARLERRLASRTTAPAAGTPAAHVEGQMRENLHASERVRLSARRARAEFRPRVEPPAARGRGARFMADDAGNIVDAHATPPARYIQPDRSATDILQNAEHPGLDPFTARTHTHPAEAHVNPRNPAQGTTRLGDPRPVTTEEVRNIVEGTATRSRPRGR